MVERILVTGGAGFIGSHTVDQLLAAGKQVLVLDNLSSGQILNLNLNHPHLEFVEGDILEFPLMQELLASCDAVLHLAAIASVPLSIEDPIYSFQVNVQGLLHVLDAIRCANRPIRLVYASSAAVYGDVSQLPCRDDVILQTTPLSPYALQKRENEDYARLYYALHQLPSLGLRYFNVYGPRQNPSSSYSGVISRFIDGYKSDDELIVYGDGQQSRDFISVEDIARANVLALDSQYTGVLNVATGQASTLLELLKCIEIAGKRPVKYRFEPARTGDIKVSYAATRLAEQHLQFKSAVLFQDGIKQLVA